MNTDTRNFHICEWCRTRMCITQQVQGQIAAVHYCVKCKTKTWWYREDVFDILRSMGRNHFSDVLGMSDVHQQAWAKMPVR